MTRCARPRRCRKRAFADPKISFVWDSEVAEVQGDQKLSGLKLRNVKTGELSDLAVTGLFIAIGHDPRTELFKGQLDLDPEGYLKVDAPSTRTNLTGVFGAGDVVDHTYRQAITAAGTGLLRRPRRRALPRRAHRRGQGRAREDHCPDPHPPHASTS